MITNNTDQELELQRRVDARVKELEDDVNRVFPGTWVLGPSFRAFIEEQERRAMALVVE